MINHYKKPLILHLGCLILFSCTKETVVAPAIPSAISELRAWTQKTDPLKLASSIAWEAAIPIKLSDSVSAYAAPVRNTYPAAISPDFMEFITFELAGKRYGLYKSYRRLNETDMEIIIQSIEGETLKAGFLRKKKALSPKGKSVSLREMNLDMEVAFIYEYIMGILLNNVNVYGTGGGGGYIWGYSRPNSMNYYGNYEGGESVNENGSGGDHTNYIDYNYSEMQLKLTNPCFKEVLADLQKNNAYSKISAIIQKFDYSKRGLKYSVIINENTASLDTNLKGRNAYVDGKVITLNSNDLKTASKEYIARVIIHEYLHIYIGGKVANDDHQVILHQYVNEIASFLNSLYDTNEHDAKILALLGLQKEKECYEFILDSLGSDKWEVYNIDQKYKNQNYGKHCN